ncbi:response regulator [Deinococcus hopiensis]|uniref:CheY chemotaxis protein or a CheY-like REC (Receiver) domain n=1 Tax=Deinococcus hopiensis KR-140 TaxID=695939 RepID=A0A1W1UCW8_9DEIO|nr:response regulator [Deinococcus hopiensis]SMB78909.1 CheY chemotaxis protein or a CheY-like REC (receiver) domain [Deinococcus hopiensis KR-140]
MRREGVKLLLVEDNPADVFLMETALELSALPVTLEVARDGVEALEQLEAGKAAERFPDLILLDLNMPRLDGFEVLAALREDPALRHLAVVVFTTSSAPDDVKRAYTLQANSYVSKPASLDEFLHLMTLLDAYWFGAASLPRTYQP